MFYSYVRSKAKTKDKIGPLKDETGQLVVDEGDMCKLLNKYFSSVFTLEPNVNESKDIPKIEQVFKGDQTNVLVDIKLNEDSVLKKIEEFACW